MSFLGGQYLPEWQTNRGSVCPRIGGQYPPEWGVSLLRIIQSSNISNSKNGIKSSGTGFAISSEGYILTNQHVVEGSSKIFVRGVKGNFLKVYSAEIVVEDKNNDLAAIAS